MREYVAHQSLVHEDQERIKYYFNEAHKVAQSLGVNLRLPRTTPRKHGPGTPGKERCDWPWTGVYISYEGYMMPCCMVSTPDRANLGKMTDRTLMSVWNSDEYNHFRQQLDSENPPEICLSCSIYWGVF